MTETTNGPKVEPKQQQIADSSVLEVDSYGSPLESVPMLFEIPSSGKGLITVYFFAEKMPADRRIPQGGEAIVPTHFKPIRLVPWFDAPLLHTPAVLTHRIVSCAESPSPGIISSISFRVSHVFVGSPNEQTGLIELQLGRTH